MCRFIKDKFFKVMANKNGYLLTPKNQRHIAGTNHSYDEAVRIVKEARMERNPFFSAFHSRQK